MSEKKRTVQNYMDCFNNLDHQGILSCLTDDVVWELPGIYCLTGKEAFDREIENPAFSGHPVIKVTRMTEEKNVVVAEGTVHGRKADGEELHLVFCDVFEMRGEKIARLISYLMPLQG